MWNQCRCTCIFSTHDQCSINREQVYKLFESPVHRFKCREEIRVVMFNTRHDCDLRLESQKHIVIFIGFDDKRLAPSRMCVDAEVVHHTTNDEGGILPKLR